MLQKQIWQSSFRLRMEDLSVSVDHETRSVFLHADYKHLLEHPRHAARDHHHNSQPRRRRRRRAATSKNGGLSSENEIVDHRPFELTYEFQLEDYVGSFPSTDEHHVFAERQVERRPRHAGHLPSSVRGRNSRVEDHDERRKQKEIVEECARRKKLREEEGDYARSIAGRLKFKKLAISMAVEESDLSLSRTASRVGDASTAEDHVSTDQQDQVFHSGTTARRVTTGAPSREAKSRKLSFRVNFEAPQ
ncbi:unnamed protein product [Amoebophrya sp. A120]|nr:unnamed protein product [Amoebophrya sp. A120]|eukprot:GSA120T00009778001.1